MKNLEKLNTLNIGGNKFSQLPVVVQQLEGLKVLNLKENKTLIRIEKEVSQLPNLITLNCFGCTSLQHPPYTVCEQKLDAIRKYFDDLDTSVAKIEWTDVPVYLVGNRNAGKSSIKISLLDGQRYLTGRYRNERSLSDLVTDMFQVQSLPLSHSNARLIALSGHDVLDFPYTRLLRERCVPLIVVNIKEFSKLSSNYDCKEAARQVCFDWLARIYVSHPQLESPILALTHVDQLSCDNFTRSRTRLLEVLEVIRKDILKEEKRCSIDGQGSLSSTSLSNKEKPILHEDDIFEFGNDLAVTSNIEALKDKIDYRCKKLKTSLPQLLETVSEFLDEHIDKVFLTISEVRRRFSYDADPIFRYLHNSGKIFWFENIEGLSSYIFHRIPEIAKMISLLLHDCAGKVWRRHLNSFASFVHDKELISRRRFESRVQEFTDTGVLDEVLLAYLLLEESAFPFEVAILLFKTFNILHGPIAHITGTAYIIPNFMKTWMGRTWKHDRYLQLRMDVTFIGLPLPMHFYQQMTARVLSHKTSPRDTFWVAKDGATVEHDGNATHFVHDYNKRKITLQVSTSLKLLENSWKHLLNVAKSVLDSSQARTEVVIYCAHCLFLRAPDPSYEAEPEWLHLILENEPAEKLSFWTTFNSENVSCRNFSSSKSLRLTVPKPFRTPCKLY